jgi:hypothetical protein
MKKITLKGQLYNSTIGGILLIIGIAATFIGIMMTSFADDNNMTFWTVCYITISVGVVLMISTALAMNEGIFGLIFGIMLACSVVAFISIPFIGFLPWLPATESVQLTVMLIAFPLMAAGGAGAACVRVFVIFI